jgi:tRNA modification GTPase
LWLSDKDDDTILNESSKEPTLAVRTKADLLGDLDSKRLSISAKTGKGIDELLTQIIDFARDHFSGVDRVSVGTDRQMSAAEEAIASLRCTLSDTIRPLEVVAEDLRAAEQAIGRISGRIEVEEVLGQIFSQLCVGK